MNGQKEGQTWYKVFPFPFNNFPFKIIIYSPKKEKEKHLIILYFRVLLWLLPAHYSTHHRKKQSILSLPHTNPTRVKAKPRHIKAPGSKLLILLNVVVQRARFFVLMPGNFWYNWYSFLPPIRFPQKSFFFLVHLWYIKWFFFFFGFWVLFDF